MYFELAVCFKSPTQSVPPYREKRSLFSQSFPSQSLYSLVRDLSPDDWGRGEIVDARPGHQQLAATHTAVCQLAAQDTVLDTFIL